MTRIGRAPKAAAALVAVGCLLAPLPVATAGDVDPLSPAEASGPEEARTPALLTVGDRLPALPRPQAGEQPNPDRVPDPDSPVAPADLTDSAVPEPAPQRAPGWNLLMAENFEGAFPTGLWTAFDNDGAVNGEYFWDDDDYLPHTGDRSAWAANGGADGLDPELYYYPNDMDSWMVYGPFDLGGAAAAYLEFTYWNRSELGYDFFYWAASADGSSFSGVAASGNSGGWRQQTLDLADYLGEPAVWVAFVFRSDHVMVDEGPFVDDVALYAFFEDTGLGMLRVTTSPPVPSQILVDGIPRDTWGLTWVKLPAGPYELSFEDVEGFTTPPPQQVMVISGATSEAGGGFAARGWLRVITDPAVPATILVDGVPRNDWGMWTDLPPGTYQVCFGDVAGFTTPPCQTATLPAGATTTVTGAFAAAPTPPPAAPGAAKLSAPPLRVMTPTPAVTAMLRARGHQSLAQAIPSLNPTAARTPGPRMGALSPDGTSAAAGVIPPTVFRTLAILVDFSDQTSQVSASFFDTLVFGTAGTKTVNRYYHEASYGLLDIVTLNLPSSLGWRTAPQTMAYYTNGRYCTGATYPRNCQKLAEDATAAVDALVDFSRYDNDGDGWVDTVFIIHAGRGAEATGDPNHIWSHSWVTATGPLYDGVRVGSYTTEPEYWFTPGDMTHGVYVHELGHALGLPDLYDYDGSSEGVGRWSLMGRGSWNGVRGDTPALPDAWSRVFLGFNDVVNVSGASQTIGLPAVAGTQAGSIYRLDGANVNEYWLLENRQRIGSDAALPGHGLLVWHIDEAAASNDNECLSGSNWLCAGSGNHYRVALEQADGLYQLELGTSAGDGGDPFPGTAANRAFHDGTNPNSSSYYTSAGSGVTVSDISDSVATMTAVVGSGQGMLRVTTSPPVASQILVDGIPRDTWGLTWLKLPAGEYQVSFSDVAGFTTPAPRTVTISPGVTTETAGGFTARAWLRVITNPAVPGTILVDGVPRNDWGMWTDLPAGIYQVCFGDVPGFTTPPCQTATLTAGATTIITAAYG